MVSINPKPTKSTLSSVFKSNSKYKSYECCYIIYSCSVFLQCSHEHTHLRNGTRSKETVPFTASFYLC